MILTFQIFILSFSFIRTQNLFLIKFASTFYLASNFQIFHDLLKCFKDKQESNSVIPSDGVYGIDSCKVNGLWWGPNIWDSMIDGLFGWFGCHTWFILPMICMWPSFNCALISLLDSALKIVAQVRICPYSGIAIRMFWYSYVHDWFEYLLISSSLPRRLHFISRDPTLGT